MEPLKYPEFSEKVTEEDRKHFYKDYPILSRIVDANGTLETYIKAIGNIKSEPNYKSAMVDYIWTFLGPVGVPTHPSTTSGAPYVTGEGWVNALNLDPSTPDTIIVGGRHGGLWKTEDLGNSWEPLTDNYMQINGIRSFAVDPFDPDHILLLSGKAFGVNLYNVSNGLYSSSNGGSSWSFNPVEIYSEEWYPTANYTKQFRKILFHPTIEELVFIITYSHVLKSTDGGDSWALMYDGNYNWWDSLDWGFFDLEFDTYNSNILYVSGNYILKTYDLGNNWSDITDSITGSSKISERVEMDVEDHSPGDVWFLVDEGTERIYYYPGTYPTQDLGSISIYGSSRMLEFDVSPVSSDIIYAAGLIPYRYTVSTSHLQALSNMNASPTNPNWTHTDVRSIQVIDHAGVNRIYLGHDGGISWCEDDGTNYLQDWSNISDDGTDGLQLTEFYGIGSSELNPDLIMGGCQDVAGFYYDGTTWYHTNNGDCGETKFSNLETNTVFQLTPCCGTGYLDYSTNGGEDTDDIFSHVITDVFRPLTLKNNSDTILVGWDNIIVVPDYTTSASRYSLDLPGNNIITAIEVSKYNDGILYAARDKAFFYWDMVDPEDYSNSIFRSEDNGDSWEDISANFMGLYEGYVSDFETNPFNPNEIWASLAISSDNPDSQTTKKIYKSSNGGDSWTAFETGFPEYIPVSKIEFDKDEYVLYIASDIGVYYRRLDRTSWNPYNYGLPLKIVTDLEINNSAAKVRIGTLGRGIWEAPTRTTYNSSNTDYVAGTEYWDEDKTVYTDIEITGKLVIEESAIITMHPGASITVKSGGELEIIDEGIINHANLIVNSGGTVTMYDVAQLILYDDDEVLIELGAICEINSGEIVKKD